MNIENKDEKLHNIIINNLGNIAQYISFSPKNIETPKYIHIKGNNLNIQSTKEAIIKLINSAKSQKINIRSFSSERMKGNPLHYNKGIDDLEEILKIIKKNASNNMHSIINENIDISDGGVSGVLLNDLIEFSPNATPKCVDAPGVCRLPKELGFKILKIIYGFIPNILFSENYRVEFSIHPKRQGLNNEHTVIWEYEKNTVINKSYTTVWPNNFSRYIGDKAYGLLIAYCLGFKVPNTTVISRNLPPFTFGLQTNLFEKWIRTCPVEKEPGKYFTGDKWVDPFKMLKEEETKGEKEINIASILSQNAVEAVYSGASIIRKNEDIIEGVSGKGDKFMIGKSQSCTIPKYVLDKLKQLNNNLRNHYNLLGEISIEWVFDGKDVWILQLNQLKESSHSNIIVEGNPSHYEEFQIEKGLENLRILINKIKNQNIGIILKGNVGITSHFGDVLRLAKIPSYIMM